MLTLIDQTSHCLSVYFGVVLGLLLFFPQDVDLESRVAEWMGIGGGGWRIRTTYVDLVNIRAPQVFVADSPDAISRTLSAPGNGVYLLGRPALHAPISDASFIPRSGGLLSDFAETQLRLVC